MEFKAIIFDFDGVITDTEPVHMEAWQGVLEDMGISFDEDEYRTHYLGLNDRDFLDAVGHIHGRFFDDAEKTTLIVEKTRACFGLLERGVPLLPGVADFVEETAKSCLLAICSGATHGEIEYILKHLKWAHIFKPIISSDSVRKGKPNPEGYIRALEGLADRSDDIIFPENVLAIEDSPKGIAAAKTAGIRCLAVGNSYPPEVLSQADWIVKSLEEVELKNL